MLASSIPAQAQNETLPTLGEYKEFSDWVVGCDNLLSCSAIGMVQGEQDWEEWLQLRIERKAGPSSQAIMTISNSYVDIPKKVSLTYRDHFDKVIGRMKLESNPDGFASMSLSADDVAQLRDEYDASIISEDETVSLHGSLSGMNAALRYIDEVQGRAGGVTALVARGPKPASTVLRGRSAPIVRQAKRSSLAPYQPTADEWKNLLLKSQCQEEQSPDQFAQPTGYRLDNATTLLTVPCGHGAYNLSSVLFLARKSPEDGKIHFSVPTADHGFAPIEPTREGVELVNYTLDEGDVTLSEFSRGRSLDDCGYSAKWAWDGAQFRLIEYYRMDKCGGSKEWPRLWKATAQSPHTENNEVD